MTRRRRNAEANPIALFIIAAVLFVIAMEMVVVGYFDDKKVEALKARCTADAVAVVTNVTVETRTRTRRRNKHTVHETYYVYISDMVYEVNGEQFGLTDERTSKDFDKEDQVMIHYDPDSPDVYYLAKGGDGKKFKLALIPAGVVLLMAIIMLIAGIKTVNKKKINNGMSFEQWQEQQLKREAEIKNTKMDDVDTNFVSNSGNTPNYMSSLNSTEDYMESIGGTDDGQ